MNMNTKKKEYTKPSVKLVEWDFSEAVCQTMGNGSKVNSFTITSNKSFSIAETREGTTGTWNRVGSDRTGNN